VKSLEDKVVFAFLNYEEIGGAGNEGETKQPCQVSCHLDKTILSLVVNDNAGSNIWLSARIKDKQVS
jgi:hypothetical protein